MNAQGRGVSEDVTVCAAKAADAEVLVSLNRICDGTPRWSEAIWRQILAEQGRRRAIFLSVQQEVPCGFAVVEHIVDKASLESLGVVPQSRGLGIGYTLATAARQWACEHAAVALELEVRASNEAALGLYRRMGFAEQGRRKGYYTSPVEDAVLMALQLDEGSSGAAKV